MENGFPWLSSVWLTGRVEKGFILRSTPGTWLKNDQYHPETLEYKYFYT